MRSYLRFGGIVASVILIIFGVASIAMGANGRDTVRSNLGAEKIVGTPDMTPSKSKAAAAEAGLKNVSIPTCSVAGKSIDTGSEARCFAQYMRVHALEGTGGQVYAEMGRYVDKNGKPTDNESAAAIDPKTGQPMPNQARNLWVNETALSTALNTSYFAENVALFSIIMGIAMLLTGIGFLVVSVGLLRPWSRRESAVTVPAVTPATAA